MTSLHLHYSDSLVRSPAAGTVAERARREGNRLYKALDYEGARAAYRTALNETAAADPARAQLLANLCACHSELLQHDDVVATATQAQILLYKLI